MVMRVWSCAVALMLLLGAVQDAVAHGGGHEQHTGCGHKRVALETRQWSQLHRQNKQHLALLGDVPRQPEQQQQQQQQQQQSAAETTADGQLSGVRRLQQVSTTVPIRIWVEYQGIDQLAASTRQQLLDTVNVALGVLKKYFRVKRPRPGRLLVRPLCTTYDMSETCYAHSPDFLGKGNAGNTCGAAAINGSHIAQYRQCSQFSSECTTYQGGTGEHTDYYLYITTLQDEHCQSGAVAWALPCLYDMDSNRPLLGAANLCPEMFAKTSQDASVSVLVHELLHALGFTDDMFDKFVDDAGAAIDERRVVKSSADAFGRPIKLVISPTVVKEARAQFNCANLEGAALENEGGSGSANAHWEYRLYQGELMVATNMFAVYGKPATMSRITLAFMQDTGWYEINWDSAGFMDWGWQAGCAFAQGTCDAYITANPQQQFYCTNKDMAASTDSVCTFDGLARAGCDTPQFADGCSMRVAMYNSPNCLSSNYRIPDGDKFGWVHGANSRCSAVTYLFNNFAYQFPDANFKTGWQAAMCYPASCTATGILQYDVLGRSLDCPTGATLDLSQLMPQNFRSGSIGPCPDNALMCNTLSCNASCATGGVCNKGQCFCNLMYQGSQCEKRLTPSGEFQDYTPLPGDGASGGMAEAMSYLVMTANLQNTQDKLLLTIDTYKSAVAQLAGVPRSRVAVLSYSVMTPNSLFGRRRLASVDFAADAVTDSHSTSASVESTAGAAARQLLASTQTLEVQSRVATMNSTDADAIKVRINNSTRQKEFIATLKEAGLEVVPDSIAVQEPSGSFLSPITNSLLNPQTRQVLIIVGSCLGAVLVLSILIFAVVRCVRKQLRPRPLVPPPPMFRPGSTYASPPPAGALYGTMVAVPGNNTVAGYTVAGRTFRTRQEAEDYQLALAMQRSLQQPPQSSAWSPTATQQRPAAWSPNTTTPPMLRSPPATQQSNGWAPSSTARGSVSGGQAWSPSGTQRSPSGYAGGFQ